jgi:hypothetical protein
MSIPFLLMESASFCTVVKYILSGISPLLPDIESDH